MIGVDLLALIHRLSALLTATLLLAGFLATTLLLAGLLTGVLVLLSRLVLVLVFHRDVSFGSPLNRRRPNAFRQPAIGKENSPSGQGSEVEHGPSSRFLRLLFVGSR
jgi:hypothetical protein